MSPIQAMERSYAALREILRTGQLPPGSRLEAARLAEELGVSMTPVRDVLHRLVGERLVEASSGEGFHVPRPSESELRDLYEWNAALLSMAVRTTAAAILSTEEPLLAESLADRTRELFDRFASNVANAELRGAILAIGDRIHPYRMIEPLVLEADDDELAGLARADRGQVQVIRRYHVRRMRAAADLIRYRDRQ
jgi:DNA-binding GntR family transcriptional regulator